MLIHSKLGSRRTSIDSNPYLKHIYNTRPLINEHKVKLTSQAVTTFLLFILYVLLMLTMDVMDYLLCRPKMGVGEGEVQSGRTLPLDPTAVLSVSGGVRGSQGLCPQGCDLKPPQGRYNYQHHIVHRSSFVAHLMSVSSAS